MTSRHPDLRGAGLPRSGLASPAFASPAFASPARASGRRASAKLAWATLAWATLVGASLALLPSTAQADLPPPDGQRSVDFAVSVEGVAAFPDWVVVIYPWSTSNGAPTTEHAVVRDGERVAIGRRSKQPALWAVRRGDYEAFAATYTPTRSFEDAPLDAFFASGKATACDAEIAPVHVVAASDPRDVVVQALRVEGIEAGRCHVTPAGAAQAPREAGASPSTGAAAASPGGGCAGCSAARSDGAARAAGLGAALVAATAALGRRRRR